MLYQLNPLPGWGPAARAKDIKTAAKDGNKRKSEDGEEVSGDNGAKKARVVEAEVDEEAAMNA